MRNNKASVKLSNSEAIAVAEDAYTRSSRARYATAVGLALGLGTIVGLYEWDAKSGFVAAALDTCATVLSAEVAAASSGRRTVERLTGRSYFEVLHNQNG